MLYLGTDIELPPDDPTDDRFAVCALDPDDSAITERFSKPYVYYVSSWQGCGCGWFPDTLLFQRKHARTESNEKTRECLLRLRDLLASILEQHDSAELFLNWTGGSSAESGRRLSLTPDDFEGDALPMLEYDFATVGRSRLGRQAHPADVHG